MPTENSIRAALCYLGIILSFSAAGCAQENLRSMRATSNAMAPLIPLNADFLVRDARTTDVPAQGDVVVFKQPPKNAEWAVKRVVAIEGDEVEIVEKVLKINGKVAEEPYAIHTDRRVMPSDPSVPPQVRLRDNVPRTKIGRGEVYLLGDNRDASVDSRFFGPIPVSAISGYVVPPGTKPSN